ncbi:MAG: phenylacetate--CoA ligase family protein [Deltaproteobacteria bacterium]|nr:phenylacetate--CoA ligase family protein [Deltaproteobacteria bacterium]
MSFQNRKLRHLIRHAYNNVKYYRGLFDRAGIKPADIRTVNDLHMIPITEKNELRACAAEDILARGSDPKRLAALVTSGASGRPFIVRRGRFEDHVINMFRIRTGRQYGLRTRDRRTRVILGDVEGEKRATFLTHVRQALRVYRSYPVKCLQPASIICDSLMGMDPDVIEGYPSVLAHVAPLVQGRFSGKKLRWVVCGGESLGEVKRRAIEQGFGVRVFDTFGAHECNLVAWECEDTGLYHVCDDNVVVEVLRDGKRVAQGESGEVVITALHSYAMPFIRYCLGDMVVQGSEKCPCGQPFSTFESIKGRVRDYFYLPDGRHVHPLEIILPVFSEAASWLDQFQMTQETESRFVLRISSLRTPTSEGLEHMQKAISGRLGKGAEFRMELVDHIAFEPSGKFRDCRCLISPRVGESTLGQVS